MSIESSLVKGMGAALKDRHPVPDTVKAGGVSQISPDKRDRQVDDLVQQAQDVDSYKYPESNTERSKRKRETIEVYARLASVIKSSEEGTAAWREKSPGYDEENGYIEGSKSRDEVIKQFAEALAKRSGTLTHEIYGGSFCQGQGESSHQTSNMQPHERRLFIFVAPKLVDELQKRKGVDSADEEYREKAERNIVTKLELVAKGNLDIRHVGKREYSSYSREAMSALIKIKPELAMKSLETFLGDGYVDVDDKVDIINNFPLTDLQDASLLVNIMAKIDSQGITGAAEVSGAFIQKLKKELRSYIQPDTVAELRGLKRKFSEFSKPEQDKIISERKVFVRGLLLQMDFGGDTDTAVQALMLMPSKLESEFSSSDRPKLFDVYGDNIDRIGSVSETVIKAMPEFVFGKSARDPDDFRVRSESDKILARVGLLRDRNVMNPNARVHITSEFFKGFQQLLQIASGESRGGQAPVAKLEAYVDSMLTMYRKLDLEDRNSAHLNDYTVTQSLNKLAQRSRRYRRLEKKLRKVGFSRTTY